MNKKILIISLEGRESYTETNFFNRIFKLDSSFSKLGVIGKCIGIGMLGESSKKEKEKKFKYMFDNRLSMIGFIPNVVFFIGDGDSKTNIKSMQRARDCILSYFKEEKRKHFSIKIYKEIHYDEDKKFEDIILNKLSKYESKDPKGFLNLEELLKKGKHKKKSYKSLVDNIINFIDPNEQKEMKEIWFEIFEDSKIIKIINFLYDKNTKN